MGGNALRAETIRLTASKYKALETEILNAWACSEFRGRRHAVIPSYFKKSDFGDMDILVSNSGNYDPASIARSLNATEIVRNGPTTSFGIDLNAGIFQIDLVGIAPELFDWAYRYYAMNDLGNLLGRIARQLGLKLGHEGLILPVRDPDNADLILSNITLTQDWSKALEFLGFRPDDYDAGLAGNFQTLQDIFNFVISSRYCAQEAFLFGNRNNAGRLRDQKRKTYNTFLTWIANAPCRRSIEGSGEYGSDQRRRFINSQLHRVFESFPGVETSYNLHRYRAIRQRAAKLIFNGNHVTKLTGLSGKALGEVMAQVRNQFADEDAFHGFVLNAEPGKMDELILRFSSPSIKE